MAAATAREPDRTTGSTTVALGASPPALLGLTLLGHDRRLELGRAGLLFRGQRRAVASPTTSLPVAAVALGRGAADAGRVPGRCIGRRWPGRVVVPLARLAIWSCGSSVADIGSGDRTPVEAVDGRG